MGCPREGAVLVAFPKPLVQLDSFTCFLSIHSIIPFFNSLFTWVVSASGPRLPPPTPCPSSHPLRIPQTLQHLHNSMPFSHLLPSACFAPHHTSQPQSFFQAISDVLPRAPRINVYTSAHPCSHSLR